MAERRYLTRRFVSRVKPPKTGERWIADTQLGGFGLRLWRTKRGEGMAFGIRCTDYLGRAIRKTFDPEKNGWRTRLDRAYSLRKRRPTYGDFIEDAREWARDEIDVAKGVPTIGMENRARWNSTGAIVRKLSLGRAAASLLAGMKANGRTDSYVDRLDKLFHQIVPATLQSKTLEKVSASQLARALVNRKFAAGNIRTLRSFIGQVFERASNFDGRLGRFHDKFSDSFNKRWQHVYDVRFPELRKLKESDYEAIFRRLENEVQHKHQAICILLFFELSAPLSRVMAGQWRSIIADRWYPYLPAQKVLWHESAQKISKRARYLLDQAASKKEAQRKNPYWFPSSLSRSGHIRTVNPLWRNTLQRCGLSYYPIREFARSYRDPSNPSYMISFLRQYGPMFRKANNAAKLSKMLERRKIIQ